MGWGKWSKASHAFWVRVKNKPSCSATGVSKQLPDRERLQRKHEKVLSVKEILLGFETVSERKIWKKKWKLFFVDISILFSKLRKAGRLSRGAGAYACHNLLIHSYRALSSCIQRRASGRAKCIISLRGGYFFRLLAMQFTSLAELTLKEDDNST